MSAYPFPNPDFIRDDNSDGCGYTFYIPRASVFSSASNNTTDAGTGRNSTTEAGSRARKWSRSFGSTTERPRIRMSSVTPGGSGKTENVDKISEVRSLKDEKSVAGLVDDMLSAFTVSALASLNIPDLLKDGPKTATELANLIQNTDASQIERLCDACVALDYLQLESNLSDRKRYMITTLGEKLLQDAPGSMRYYIMGETDLVHIGGWNKCTDCVKTGTTQTKEVFGQYIWEYYETHPEEEKLFMAGMGAFTRDFNNAITLTYDFVGTKVVDLGGSHGHFLVSVLKNLPNATGILFELEGCINQAQSYLKTTSVYDRITCQVGDFFQSVSQGDLYLLKWLIHEWDDANVIKILRNGIVDFVIDGMDPHPLLFDMHMLNLTHGRERTIDQFLVLFKKSGLKLTSWKKTPCPLSVLELVADEKADI